MNFDNIKIPSHVKVNFLQRKWYGKYLCKLVFEIDKTKLVKSNTRDSYYSYRTTMYLNRRELVETLHRNVKNKIKNDDYRLRVESYNVSVFTNDEADVERLVSHLGARLQSIDRPLNEAHIDLVSNHTKVLVRKKLFEDRYRFKIYFKPDWKEREERYPKIRQWIESLTCDYKLNSVLDKFFNSKYQKTRAFGYTIAVYINDPSDLMMCQLRFNDAILKVEEAVLLEDLESDKKTV